VKTPKKENSGQCDLAKPQVYQLLEKVDSELAEKVRQTGCLHCQGKLDRAKYERKPRGGPKEDQDRKIYRESFCCNRDGCRKRHTPPSVRFLGRKVYWAVVVILVAALQHGLQPERVRLLRVSLGQIDRRTLERWRAWWLENFVQSSFWKAARARFMPSLCEQTLPLSLCQAFQSDPPDWLVELLKFLSPVTTSSIPLERSF
jgi:hypothetical protein